MTHPVDRNYSLLLADADPVNCVKATTALSDHGHEVTSCQDGETAWRLLQNREFDLAMIDLDLPGVDGFEVIARCRGFEALISLPIIALGSGADDDSCDRAFSLGATFYVPRPVQLPLLSHSVWYVLRNSARDREMRWLKERLGIESNRGLELAY